MLNILITGIGGPTPRSIAKAIRIEHPGFRLIGIDSNPKALGFYMPGLIDKYKVAPRMGSHDYWSFIFNLIGEERIDLAFVQPEVEVIGWGKYANEHNAFPCPVFIPPVEIASALMDKSIMADILRGTAFIPKTIKVTQADPHYAEVESEIGFPCWIRATRGSGGLGSLKLINQANLKSWLFINIDINEFTISEYLPGRHLATQMLYYNGEYIKGASLECAEYVMASIAPSRVTGNTAFGRLINEDRILSFCDDCINYISGVLNIKPHGVLSFDLKEDSAGNLKVTEVNIRHMAYTGVMASAGFNLVEDTLTLLQDCSAEKIVRQPFFKFDRPYIFLRDVDTEPVLLESEDVFSIR
jgi:hypothetical protein